MFEITVNHLLYSATATRRGICNRPPMGCVSEVMANLKGLAELLNVVQRELRKKVVVTSGYRSELLNRVVGGVVNSQHIRGQAVDFYVEGMTAEKVASYIKQFFFYDQLIVYNNKAVDKGGLIHLSRVMDGVNRRQFIRVG